MQSIKIKVWDGGELISFGEAWRNGMIGFTNPADNSGKLQTLYTGMEFLLFINEEDRQGIEIYTDYIVEVLGGHSDKFMVLNNPWVVTQYGCRCRLEKQLNEMGDRTIRDMPNGYFLKVIGNIYENPELLECKEVDTENWADPDWNEFKCTMHDQYRDFPDW